MQRATGSESTIHDGNKMASGQVVCPETGLFIYNFDYYMIQTNYRNGPGHLGREIIDL